MIELEIQGLSPDREGLLIEVGRFVTANGFTLQKQRLVTDSHGILLTMVVRGAPRGKKTLEAALGAYQRLISFQIFPFVADDVKPHFAASHPRVAYSPPPAPAVQAIAMRHVSTPAPPPAQAPSATINVLAKNAPANAVAAVPAMPDEPEIEFIQPTPQPPAPAPEVAAPFIDVIPLGPDEAAVETMLCALPHDYPKVIPQLLILQQSVAEGARDSSLRLAGRRTGHWVFQSEYLLDNGLSLDDAVERLGVPSLLAFTEVDQHGAQVHILDSPLCSEGGPSGCSFFGGFLEGLLEPAITPETISIFSVCCRSYGADACVLALSD